MLQTKVRYTTIDHYISLQPSPVQDILQHIRRIVHEVAPSCEETISYGIPCCKLREPLVYFAAFPQHIGLYPTPSGIAAFQKELSGYKMGKGSVQFPLDAPIPYDLVRKIVQRKVKENNT